MNDEKKSDVLIEELSSGNDNVIEAVVEALKEYLNNDKTT